MLAVGILLIATWQASFMRLPQGAFDASHRVTAASGIDAEPRFFFFLYRLGLYPVAGEPQAGTREEAERLLREEADTLVQEEGLTLGSGERGRAYLYFVDAWLGGDPLAPSLRPANALAFGAALVALFAAFWWVRRPLTGALLALLLGSSPFQLHAIHGEEGLFSWSITVMVALMALHVPLLPSGRKPVALVVGVAIATGLFMGAVRHVRVEPMVMLAAPVFVYATLSRSNRLERLAATLTLFAVFSLTSAGIAERLEAKLESAGEAIAAAGGTPYDGPVERAPSLWHSIFRGLGDFDERHGYAWDDRVAYAYALGAAEARAGKRLHLDPRTWAQRESYDGHGRYPVSVYEAIPQYREILRDKVLGDIKAEPRWYLGILEKRAIRVLTEAPPVAVRVGGANIAFAFPWFGVACGALLVALALLERADDAKLLLFAAPLSAPALLLYSAGGMTSYSSVHVVGAALALALAGSGLAWLLRRLRARAAA